MFFCIRKRAESGGGISDVHRQICASTGPRYSLLPVRPATAMGIKKAGRSLNPYSRLWTAHKEDWRNAHAEKRREHQPFYLLYIKTSKFRIQKKKPMRFQYVCDKDTNYFSNHQMQFANCASRSRSKLRLVLPATAAVRMRDEGCGDRKLRSNEAGLRGRRLRAAGPRAAILSQTQPPSLAGCVRENKRGAPRIAAPLFKSRIG